MNLETIGAVISLAGIAFIGIASLMGFLSRLGWQLELFSHFRVQYTFLLSGFTCISLLSGEWIITALGLALVFINLTSIIPIYFPSSRKNDGSNNTSRILLSNLLRPNEEYEKLRKIIHETQPDIIVLIEISNIWLQELNSDLEKFTYRHIAPHYHNYGIALFSRYPLNDVQTKIFSDAKVPSIIAILDINGCPIKIIATHPPPPKSKEESLQRNQQLNNIAAYINSQPGPFIVIGDLNMTSWSPYFQEFIHQTGLHDSRQGFGIHPTWPADKPIFMIPLDHLLVSDGILIHNRFIGAEMGSDHRPVIVDFSLETCADKVNSLG